MKDCKWRLLKERYPIGHIFWARISNIKPFGIFLELENIQNDSYRYLGVVDIGHAYLCPEICKILPLERSKWPSKGIYINCIVCYYRERNRQLGLGWLGDSSNLKPV